MLVKLMNNPYVGFIFGVIITYLTYKICILSGETLNVWAFAGILGVIASGIKEAINHFVVSTFNSKVLYSGIAGSVLLALIILFI